MSPLKVYLLTLLSCWATVIATVYVLGATGAIAGWPAVSGVPIGIAAGTLSALFSRWMERRAERREPS